MQEPGNWGTWEMGALNQEGFCFPTTDQFDEKVARNGDAATEQYVVELTLLNRWAYEGMRVT